MKGTIAASLVLMAALFMVTTPVLAQQDRPGSYLAVKGGIYSPSEDFDLRNINGGTTSRLDPDTGFNGEVAIGHYFLPFLAVELGAGYFQSKASPAIPPGETKLKVVPVVATGKLILPAGPVEPYGEFGIGAYISELDVEGNVYNFNTSTKVTYGLHAGAGLNLNLTNTFFLGAEARYLWVEPSFGGEDIRLDGFTATGNLGFRF